LWDGCTLINADKIKIEKLQLEAASLPCYCSKYDLYYETGWITFDQRKEN